MPVGSRCPDVSVRGFWRLPAVRRRMDCRTGLLERWVKFIADTEKVTVSHHYVAALWREAGLKPHRQGTFKLSRDPRFAEKVADIVGLYLDPPAGAVVLSVDEKTQVQALDRTQPLLPVDFGATEKRTHDYVRHGTTNLFAALDTGSGAVYGECHPTRDGARFLTFLKAAVKPHADKRIHVILDSRARQVSPMRDSVMVRLSSPLVGVESVRRSPPSVSEPLAQRPLAGPAGSALRACPTARHLAEQLQAGRWSADQDYPHRQNEVHSSAKQDCDIDKSGLYSRQSRSKISIVVLDDAGHELIERHMAEQLREVAKYTRVVLINGPRQAGKTTLLEQLHAELGGWLRSLDVDVERASARADPEGYVMSAPRPTFLDEVQRTGDPLILAIKTATDRDRRPGQFFLSGSTRFLTVPTLSESLAGRVAILDLWPLSVAERAGVRPEIIAQLLTNPQAVLGIETAPVTRHEYLQLACTGGFPEVVRRPVGRARSRWFSDYLRTVTQRDVRELKQVEHMERLPRFMRYLAAITAQELNVAEAGRVIGVDAGTIRSDLALFETVYLVHRLSAWSQNLTAKIKKRSKIHVVDSGFAAWLRGQSADSLARPTAEGAGPIMETFVINELMKLRAAGDLEVDLYHFRDRDGREIDCILQTADGRVVGVEVKASMTVNIHDFRHLSFARDRLGDQFITGVVFYTGARALPFGDRLMALPMNLLWNGQSVSGL